MTKATTLGITLAKKEKKDVDMKAEVKANVNHVFYEGTVTKNSRIMLRKFLKGFLMEYLESGDVVKSKESGINRLLQFVNRKEDDV